VRITDERMLLAQACGAAQRSGNCVIFNLLGKI